METFIGSVIGFVSFTLTSHPKSPLSKRLPKKKFKNIHIVPEIKLLAKNKVVHLHHWLIFSSVYVASLFIHKGFLQSDVFQGFVLGSIAQGLTYEDRFMIIYHAAGEKIRGKKLIIPHSENPHTH